MSAPYIYFVSKESFNAHVSSLYSFKFISMAPFFLTVGATGNTGRGVVETLWKILQTSLAFPDCPILALTRASNSPAAQQLTQLPDVSITEQNWTEITTNWLREWEVTRAFIVSHNQANQLTEESTFYYVAALRAGVVCCTDLNNSRERPPGL